MKQQPEHTIAVLPFANISADPGNEYFSDGMTEEIINALARIEGLKVTSRTSSFYFKNKSIPLKEVAHQLGVSIILEGSVRLAGDTVRITAQLIQAAEDFHFWSATWDRKLENIFEIQDKISVLIADKLREQLGHFEVRDHLVERQTENLNAYAYSLKGQYYFNKWNPQDVRTAIELFEKAITLDPNHTESYVGLADAYGFMATTEFMPRAEAWQKAIDFTQKAHHLNPKNAGVHYQLANLSFFTDCNFREAFLHGQKSIELKPSYPEAQQFMAFLYILAGDMAAADNHLQLALKIDPLSQETLFYKAYFDYRNGHYTTALDQLDALLSKNPKNIPGYIVRSYCLLKLGRYEEVLAYLAEMPEDIIIPQEQLGLRTLAYLMKGDEAQGRKHLMELEAVAEDPHAFQAHSYLYLAYATMGRADAAFEWLEKTTQMKSSVLLLTIADPLADNLLHDPRHARLKRQLLALPDTSPSDQKTRSPLLDAATAADYERQLLEYIAQEEPYLNPALSLRSLAGQLLFHPNQLSWLLNERLGKNFNEFINHYRVATFKKLATDPANAHISLLGLAYESGFNSKTVFNTYFKKETGLTPKAFLKAQAES